MLDGTFGFCYLAVLQLFVLATMEIVFIKKHKLRLNESRSNKISKKFAAAAIAGLVVFRLFAVRRFTRNMPGMLNEEGRLPLCASVGRMVYCKVCG